VQLAAGASLSEFTIAEEQRLFVSHFDIENAFYAFKLPFELRRCFGCPPLAAQELGISSLGGVSVAPKQRIYPCLSVLPMGFTHALWACQEIHVHIFHMPASTARR
jgi:hypothetical protein